MATFFQFVLLVTFGVAATPQTDPQMSQKVPFWDKYFNNLAQFVPKHGFLGLFGGSEEGSGGRRGLQETKSEPLRNANFLFALPSGGLSSSLKLSSNDQKANAETPQAIDLTIVDPQDENDTNSPSDTHVNEYPPLSSHLIEFHRPLRSNVPKMTNGRFLEGLDFEMVLKLNLMGTLDPIFGVVGEEEGVERRLGEEEGASDSDSDSPNNQNQKITQSNQIIVEPSKSDQLGRKMAEFNVSDVDLTTLKYNFVNSGDRYWPSNLSPSFVHQSPQTRLPPPRRQLMANMDFLVNGGEEDWDTVLGHFGGQGDTAATDMGDGTGMEATGGGSYEEENDPNDPIRTSVEGGGKVESMESLTTSPNATALSDSEVEGLDLPTSDLTSSVIDETNMGESLLTPIDGTNTYSVTDAVSHELTSSSDLTVEQTTYLGHLVDSGNDTDAIDPNTPTESPVSDDTSAPRRRLSPVQRAYSGDYDVDAIARSIIDIVNGTRTDVNGSNILTLPSNSSPPNPPPASSDGSLTTPLTGDGGAMTDDSFGTGTGTDGVDWSGAFNPILEMLYVLGALLVQLGMGCLGGVFI